MASTDKIEVPASLIDAINGLPDAVFLVMDDGVIIAANVAADDMFGYSHSQLIGSQVDELMPAGAREYHHKVRTDATSDRRLRQFTSGPDVRERAAGRRGVPGRHHALADQDRRRVGDVGDCARPR